MKTYKSIIAIGIVVTALLLFVIPVAAESTFTEFTDTESCPTVINPGTWAFPDSHIQVRGMVVQCTDVASDARFSGSDTVVINGNWDSSASGPVWGTLHLVNAGGEWEGTWQGMKTGDVWQFHGTGTGKGGYEGLKFWIDSPGGGVIVGRILNPKGE